MSATVRLSDCRAIQFDPINGTRTAPAAGVLLTLAGRHQGELLNCSLIPIDRIGAVIESLRLVASQVQQ